MMEEIELRDALRAMELDLSLVTQSSYSTNTVLWPDHRISFIEKHVAYLKTHPAVNTRQYLANLRIMIKKRT